MRTLSFLFRKRRSQLLLALLVLAVVGSLFVASGANFTSASANPSNVFTAGTLHHVNSKSGSAILTASLMKPGDTASGTVQIQNDGDLAGTFSLAKSNIVDTPGSGGGSLLSKLTVTIVDTTTSTTVYTGVIGAMGTRNAGTIAAGATHTYTFTVTFPDTGTNGEENAYMASSLSIDYNWTAVSS